ncbi:uncharacterized protein [Palaemon carinicauda]|uniref:uncharacterized protein n=1 Tax=Palaemon carinicauda TaxID=392227 RepID=UPI0035B5BB84
MKLLLIFVSITTATALRDEISVLSFELDPSLSSIEDFHKRLCPHLQIFCINETTKVKPTPEPISWTESVLQEIVASEEEYQTFDPHHNILMADIEDYGDCLSEAGFGTEILKDLIVVYIGQPELKLVCKPLCKRPMESLEPEWFFLNKYFSNTSLSLGNKTKVEMMKNVIVGFGKTTLVLKDLSVEHAGKYYCKYDDIVIREYWIYVIEHSSIDFSFIESQVSTIPKSPIYHPDWGITVVYKTQNSNCVLRTYKEILIDDSNILNATWWTHKLINAKWWQRVGRRIRNFFSKYPKEEYLSPPRIIKQAFPFLVINNEHSPEIQAKYYEVSTLDLFSGKEIPFVPDFMPSNFSAELFNQTYISESNCTAGSSIQRSYKERTFYINIRKPIKISCFGMKETDVLIWTKDGVNLFSSKMLTVTKNRVKIHGASLRDAGKYTCWQGDSPVASTIVLVQSPLSLAWVKITFQWALSILITICLLTLPLIMIYYVLNSIIMFLNFIKFSTFRI